MGKFIYLFLGIVISFGSLSYVQADFVPHVSNPQNDDDMENHNTTPLKSCGAGMVLDNDSNECLDKDQIMQKWGNKVVEQNLCQSSYQKSQQECEGLSDAATLAIINQLSSSAGRAVGGVNNARAGCAASAVGGSTAMSSTLYLALQCFQAAGECIQKCSDKDTGIKTYLTECTSHKKKVMMGGVVSLSQLTGLIGQATACEQGLANNTNLPTYTPPPLPTTDLNSGSAGTPEGSGAYTGLGDEDDYGPTFDGYASNKQGSSKAEATENAGGGGGPQAGAYPGGAPNNQAQQAGGGGGPFKDPDRGFNSGGGGFSVSGVPTSGGGGGGYGRNSGKDKDGIDWSKFLPGGEMDPSKRGLASAEGQLALKGITGANDLTNFEKVTRMMNKKRALLKP
ncbi:MAG: hypothetical protein IPM57_05150 [Oligoflexia bacterium]|nr:hypothetical protein [Oligoflexia bacterium]